MPKVFVTADTHFGHANIIGHCSRPFAGVDEMDAALIYLWNSTVGVDDHVWHLGDFAFRNHAQYLDQLNGKIHLCLGNHDKFSTTVRDRFFEVKELFYGRLTGDATSPKFFLFHYPLVSWPQKFGPLGTIHLFGHVHGRYSRPGERGLDVGVDVHSFSPIELDEAIRLADQNYAKGTEKAQQINQASVGTCPEPSSGNLSG